MAKKNMIEREKKRDKLIIKYKKARNILKKEIKQSQDFNEVFDLQNKLQKMPRNSMQCRKRNICWMTGRSRGFYRDFGLSRHVFREMSHQCLLPGIRKSSW
uniref:Small ribosomal subunit protein uS14c n=1 Tax=Campylaephora sungminbooi TaxID=1896769 RepID=A0A1B0TI84_9FLOR|nr:ribosomal protein S14 [Campylaephora sungminbooi]AKU47428.1 ribosomal protein S14 [Campylaephora sungminbooi]ALN11875.1 ribosomal protein S14 [Campylaephora sungminbooi]